MAHSLNMQNFKYEDHDLEQREPQSSSKHYWKNIKALILKTSLLIFSLEKL